MERQLTKEQLEQVCQFVVDQCVTSYHTFYLHGYLMREN